MSADSSSDDEWNASQVPSSLLLQPRQQPANAKTAHPILNSIKKPLTTILTQKSRSQKATKAPRKRNNRTSAQTNSQTPIIAPSTITTVPTTASPAAAVVVAHPTPSHQPFTEPSQYSLSNRGPIGTQLFVRCADMMDVLAHRNELMDLCCRALNILVYPVEDFVQGMRFSHCVVNSKIPKLDEFLMSRLFEVGDDLNFVFAIVWRQERPNEQNIECMANIHKTHRSVAMDALHFSLCVSKRLIQ